jgi:hypothetical protein
MFSTGVVLADGAQLDAFNRLRVSSARTRLTCKFLADNKSGVWDEKLSNATAAWTSGGYVLLTLTTGAGYAVRQTYQRADYEPGKSQRVVFTSVMTPTAGMDKRAGWAVADTSAPYKPVEGVYFKAASDATMQVVKCTGGSETTFAQSAWNIDRLNGSGDPTTNPSGMNADWTKGQIFFFDLQWLALGRIRLGVEMGGIPYYCHEFDHTNELTAPYIAIPNLPLYYGIHGGGSTGTMRQICAVVESEGGKDDNGRPFSFDTLSELAGGAPAGTPPAFNDGSLHALLVMRLRSGRSHAIVLPQTFDVYCDSTSAFRWVLVRNPTVAGTALTYTQASDAVEVAKCANDNTVVIPYTTNNASAQLLAGYTGTDTIAANARLFDWRLGTAINGTSDTVALCARRLSNQNETFYAAINWAEVE